MKYDVFISYSRKDYVDDKDNIIPDNVISKIKDVLTKEGISYWFDEEGIYSGDEFASVITHAIRSSSIFLFISSVNSNKSIWASNEVHVALEFNKIIIPFRLDNTPFNDSVMMKIISFDRIENKDYNIAICKLLNAIKHHLNNFQNESLNVKEEVSNGDNKKNKEFTCSVGEDNFYNVDRVEKDISIYIADTHTPIVMPIGPSGVGKTMTLVRLVRYLFELGYTVEPDRFFRENIAYHNVCAKFQNLINAAEEFSGTASLDCLLVQIIKNGKKIVQIVDVAGECTEDVIYQILNLKNPFIWVIMIEPYWRDVLSRKEYVDKIRELKRHFSPKDKVIIVVNKIDKTPFLEGKIKIDFKGIFNHVCMEYPGLMEIFFNLSPIVTFFKPYDRFLVPFVTGNYKNFRTKRLYEPSNKYFPQKLWNEIIKGSRQL